MRLRNLLLPVSALLGMLSGCGAGDCTLVGCAGGKTSLVVLGPNWSALEPAVHTLDVQLGDTSFTVTCDIAGLNCDTPEDLTGDLEIRVFISGEGQITVDIGSDFDSGDNLPDGYAVTVTRDGSVVTQEAAAFEFEESRPNGPDCPGVCRTTDGAFVFVEP
ncbi:MAG: hypothetical protein AAGA54_02565 [Myxococcota bacterium]